MAKRWKITAMTLAMAALLYGFYHLDKWSTDVINRAYDYPSIDNVVQPEISTERQRTTEMSTAFHSWKPLIDLLKPDTGAYTEPGIDDSDVNCDGLNKIYLIEEFLTNPHFAYSKKTISWGEMKSGDPGDECKKSECVYIGFAGAYYKFTTTGIATTFRWLVCSRNADHQQIIRVYRFELDDTYVMINDENMVTHWDKTAGNPSTLDRNEYLQIEEILSPAEFKKRMKKNEL
ncbi:MAG TPA: hypothetical protein VJI98_03740 [Candidatus Nanoarchaeia archaeon]|nr:hypothetical protein [Candidatus Nanoarchaeia archaeon]